MRIAGVARTLTGLARRLAGSAGLERLGALGILVLLCLLRLWDPAPIQLVRVRTFDLFQAIGPSRNPERPVVIVDIDEESLKAHGQWPWPRTLLADLVDRVAAADPLILGFDFIFAEPDRTTPSTYAASIPNLPEEVKEALRKLPSNDARFAEAVAKTNVVLGMSLLRRETAAVSAAVRAPPVALLGGNPRPYLIGGRAVLPNLLELHKAASGAGLLNHYPEIDSVVRRVPTVFSVGDRFYPAFAIEIIRLVSKTRSLVIRTGPSGIESLIFSGAGGRSIALPVDSRGRIWVHASRHDPKRYVSAGDVLAGKVSRERLAGRIVIFGTSAAGLLDIKATPLERSLPGVEIHAQLIENILAGDLIIRPYYADAVEFFAAVLLALGLILMLPAFGAARTLVSGFCLVGITASGAWLFFSEQGLLFDISFPLIASFTIYLALTFVNYLREERQRRWVRAAFSRYLSPDFVKTIADHPERLKLGGEMRELTILFLDIRGFTSISEKLDAADLTAFINRFFTPLADVILAHGGTIDKFIGDAIMAFWNAPLDEPKHAEKACRAAIAILAATETFNRDIAADPSPRWKSLPEVRVGIGINTGRCCVGNLGSQQRFDYSAVGDPVNLASRLEGETKSRGVSIIVSEATMRQAGDAPMTALGEIQVRGRAATTKIFALGPPPALAAAK
jgi:adenylate cyclase